jgi:hypothetical protein
MRLSAPTLARFLGPAALCAAGLLFTAPRVRSAAAPDGASIIAAVGASVSWRPAGAGTDYRYLFEAIGFLPEELARVQAADGTPAQWQRLLAVHVGDPAAGLPSMAGSYRVSGGTLVFEPAFPLAPGTTYQAVLRGDSVSRFATLFHTPARPAAPATTVTHVYPSADVLPENLLKFYIHFSAPMNRGDIYKHIHLLDESGQQVYLPFLELGEELWNPAMTRVTVFIDPGRIKRGVRELMEHGPALTVGQTHTLVIDAAWTDGHGRPLREGFRKTFRVAAADRTAIDLKAWQVTPAAAGTRNALTIAFPEPLDHALGERLIQIVSLTGNTRRPLEVTATLSDQERKLSLIPAQPWPAGPHELEVPMILEDLAGNKVGKVFDVDVFDEVQRTAAPDLATLPFTIPR